MASKNLSDLNLTELKKKEKELKTVFTFSTAILILSPILIIFALFQKQYGSVCFLLLFSVFTPMYIRQANKKQLNDIKIELETRNNTTL